ncbi:MAG TPA: acyl-CoA dehydrogenase family protein [Burkholderiales bacterium]|nr:acyl-CoA dehydrogenase family protein [Burkholderiales bacterium]
MTAYTAKGTELLSRARELVPTLRNRAAEAEKLRSIPPESIADLRRAGLFRTLQPAVLGGYELPLDEAVLITATVAEGCGSTGWIQGIFSDHCATLGMFDGQAQKDVWEKSPDSLISSGFQPVGKAVRVKGGYRLSGRWPFSSGCDHADWALVRSFVPSAVDTEAPELHMFLVPKTDYTIIDNWHVMGMSGTGSKDFELRGEVFVPAHRALGNKAMANGTGPGSAFNGGALYRLPRHATVPFSLAAPLIGMAERALQILLQGLRERPSAGPRAMAEGAIHAHIASAAAEIDAARALMLRDCREAMEIVERGGELTLEQRARNRRDIAYAARQCTRALDRLFSAAGARSIFLESEAQRLLRDIHAAGQHMALNWDVAGASYARVMCGLPPGLEL